MHTLPPGGTLNTHGTYIESETGRKLIQPPNRTRPPYADYTNHMLRQYATNITDATGNYGSRIERLNYKVTSNVILQLPEQDRITLVRLFSLNMSLNQAIQKLSHSAGLSHDYIWKLVKSTSRRIAKERRLI